MSCQVKRSGQCQLRDKKHQYFSIVSLPTDSVVVDHAVDYEYSWLQKKTGTVRINVTLFYNFCSVKPSHER
jgi:archaellum component FlaG (FlaF/FlaG flagellin family)